MNQLQSASVAAGLFLLDKGTPSDFHGRNVLFSRFYNPKVSNDTPVFYMYREQFMKLYVSLLIASLNGLQFRIELVLILLL
jgi:hypothetical protein